MPAEMQYYQGVQVVTPNGTGREARETMPVQPETGLVMAVNYVQFGFSRPTPAAGTDARLIASLSTVETRSPFLVQDPVNFARFMADMEVQVRTDSTGNYVDLTPMRLQHTFNPPYLLAAPELFLAAILLGSAAADESTVLCGIRYSMTRIAREDAVLLARRQGNMGRGD